jgi:hypothetical protein
MPACELLSQRLSEAGPKRGPTRRARGATDARGGRERAPSKQEPRPEQPGFRCQPDGEGLGGWDTHPAAPNQLRRGDPGSCDFAIQRAGDRALRWGVSYISLWKVMTILALPSSPAGRRNFLGFEVWRPLRNIGSQFVGSSMCAGSPRRESLLPVCLTPTLAKVLASRAWWGRYGEAGRAPNALYGPL